jgi:acyl carrier protein
MPMLDDVVRILASTLQLGEQAAGINDATPLLGSMPEFDSMAVVAVITALEEAFGFVVEDDEIDASVFETVGTLVQFVRAKLEG